jgi:hypothetical protein
MAEALLGPAAKQREEQVVHGVEVVMDQGTVQAGLGRHAARGHGGIPLIRHDDGRRLEKLAARRGRFRTEPAA